MKIEKYQFPKSSFLSVEKDFALIINKILKSERLKQLLYYNTPDALNRPCLSQAQELDLISKNIRIVPKYYIEEELENYLIISFDQFEPSMNPEFRNNLIMIDIVCHVDQWQLSDFQLRPFKIAGEIDSILDGAHLTGIGQVEFVSCNQVVVNSDYISLCLVYATSHGDDDKKHPLSPKEETRIINNFDEMYNND